MSSSGHEAPSVLIKESCPLRIAQVFLSDPVLTLAGEDWNLTVWCSWAAGGLDFDWESPDLGTRVRVFQDQTITDFSVVPDKGPVFVLGEHLSLVLDERDVDEPVGIDEPWTMTVRGRVITGGTLGPHWS